MMILWEFQNGKVGLCSPKIKWDTTKNVKIQILKNHSFRFKKVVIRVVLQGHPFPTVGFRMTIITRCTQFFDQYKMVL